MENPPVSAAAPVQAQAKRTHAARPGPVSAAAAHERQQRILQTARELFARQGLARTSLDAIALAAQVTKRTIYQAFGDKEALFVAVMYEVITHINQTVRTHCPDEADLASQVVAIMRHYSAAQGGDAQALYAVSVGSEAHLPQGVRVALNRHGVDSAIAVIKEKLQAAEARGLVRFNDLDRFAHLFIDLALSPPFTRWLMGLGVAEDDAAVRDAAQRFLRAASDTYRLPRRRPVRQA